MIPQPPKSTLFPYTTLFRSAMYLTKVTEQTIILPTGGGRWGPKRYPDIVAHLTEPPPAHFREVAVSRDARGNYYCSFVYDAEQSERNEDKSDKRHKKRKQPRRFRENGMVAFDLGIKTLATGYT